jgi:hypothetical protein
VLLLQEGCEETGSEEDACNDDDTRGGMRLLYYGEAAQEEEKGSCSDEPGDASEGLSGEPSSNGARKNTAVFWSSSEGVYFSYKYRQENSLPRALRGRSFPLQQPRKLCPFL